MEPDFLKKAGNKPPFEVPAGYFKQLHQRITEETRRDRNALRDEPIPVFPAAVSENPFAVPEGYFETLPGQISRRLNKQKSAIHDRSIYYKTAIAACLALLLGIAGVIQVKKMIQADNFIANIANFDEEILVEEYLEARLSATEEQPGEMETYILNQVDEGMLIQEL
ncbi:MAG TPA: hypothetical protein VIR29_03120 [Anseongella sp.]